MPDSHRRSSWPVRAGAALAWVGTGAVLHNVRSLRSPDLQARPTRSVSVLIPARDEAASIRRCLASVAWQQADEVLVLDDGSTDATAEIAGGVSDARVRVLVDTGPPAGAL